MEDQTIEDIDKTENSEPQSNDSLVDLDLSPTADLPTTVELDNQDDTGPHIQNDYFDGNAPMHEIDDNQPESSVSLRRSIRNRVPSTRYPSSDFVLLTDGGKPDCFEEAMESEQKKEWLEAMEDEMKSLRDNHTFDLVKLPEGKRALKNRWVYRVK